MTALVSSIEIDIPPAEVYAFATDPTRFPQWQRDVVSVRLDGGDAQRVGTRYTTVRRMAGVERGMVQEVTAVEPARHWAVRGVSGPVRPTASITVEPLDSGARCRVTFSLDFEGHGIGVPLIPAIRALAAKGAPVSHRNLKRLLEGRPAPGHHSPAPAGDEGGGSPHPGR